MTVDIKVYEFSKIWLSAGGWTHELDIQRLAELVQSVCEDFESDLQSIYDRESQHDHR